MTVPKITNKQREIVELLYRYRFLNRIQIQALLHHKNHKTISVWLKDLREKQYVKWIYSTDFTEKTKPAIYYLDINGVRLLRSSNEYPVAEIRKRYYESDRSPGFILRSIVLGDICLSLEQKSSPSTSYVAQTAADYALSRSTFHFMTKIEQLHPDICFTKLAGSSSNIYLLEFLDATLPRYRVRRRLKNYVDYLDYDFDTWRRLSGTLERPTILFICPTVAELIYAKRRTRKLLESVPDSGDIHIKFATLDEVQKSGVISKVWEEA